MTGSTGDYDSFVESRLDTDMRSDAMTSSAVVCLATPGAPVIYVSPAFEAHTGYALNDAVGRSLAFLQGPDTEAEAVKQFRDLIHHREAGTVRITNYRKDGTCFVHECELRPVRDDKDTVTHFIAIQRPVADAV